MNGDDFLKIYNLEELVLNNYETNLEHIVDESIEKFSDRKDKVKVINGDKTYEMPFANFVTNVILLKPFFTFECNSIDDNFIITDPNNFKSSNLEKYYNRIIDKFGKSEEGFIKINGIISDITNTLDDISGTYNVLYGNSMNLYSLIELSNKNEDLYNLLNFKFPPNIEYKEIEDMGNRKLDELLEILRTEDNVMKNYLNSGTGVNVKQLRQYAIAVGAKPGLDGSILEKIVNTSLINGMRNVDDFVINASGARKAIITNYKQVRKSGLNLTARIII